MVDVRAPRGVVLVAALAAVAFLAGGPQVASGFLPDALECVPRVDPLPGSPLCDPCPCKEPLWVRVETGLVEGTDQANRIVASSGAVYVAADIADWVEANQTSHSAAYYAYDENGTTLWTTLDRRYSTGLAFDLALSPDGATVFAAGAVNRQGALALNATDGSILWTAAGPQKVGYEVAVSPDGSTVFLATQVEGVFAFDTVDGSLAWSRPDSVGSGLRGVDRIALAPDGSRLFAAGFEGISALNPVTGATTWFEAGNAYQVEASPDSSAVYATGETSGVRGNPYPLRRLDADTASVEWVSGTGWEQPFAVSGDGSAAYLVAPGGVVALGFEPHLLRVAAADGAIEWRTRLTTYGEMGKTFLSPDGSLVAVLGGDASLDAYAAATVYDATDGSRVFTAVTDYALHVVDLAFSPDGDRLYVIGDYDGDIRIVAFEP